MPDKDPQDQTRSPPEASLPPPGDLLAAGRRKHGWTLERVAQELNLDPATVLALEESRFDTLGAPVFARGHLRKYAGLLGIDPDEVVAAYDATADEVETAELPPSGLARDVMATRRRLGPLVAVVVVAAVGVLLWRIMGNGPVDTEQTVDQNEPAISDETTIIEPGTTTLSVPETRNNSESVVVAEPDLPAPAVPEPEVASAEVLVVDTIAVPAIDSGPETDVAVPAPTVEEPPAVPQMRIAMRFAADSWVEVRDAEGARLVYQLQAEGTSRSVSGTPPFRLFLGFADGVEIEVDGKPLSIPADRRLGNTARFQIPLDAGDARRR